MNPPNRHRETLVSARKHKACHKSHVKKVREQEASSPSKKVLAPHRLYVIAHNGTFPTLLFSMTIPANNTIEDALCKIQQICDETEMPPAKWNWLTDELIDSGYQIDLTNLFTHCKTFSAVAQLDIDVLNDSYSLRVWSKTQEMYEGTENGTIIYPVILAPEKLLREINWAHLPVLEKPHPIDSFFEAVNNKDDDVTTGDDSLPPVPPPPLPLSDSVEWNLNEFYSFDEKIDEYRKHVKRLREADKLPKVQSMMLGTLFEKADRLSKKYGLYKANRAHYTQQQIMEMKKRGPEIVYSIGNIIDALNAMTSPAETHNEKDTDTEKIDKLNSSAQAALTNLTATMEYAEQWMMSSPFESGI